MAGYGEWTKAVPVRDFIDLPRPLAINWGGRRHAGATRVGFRSSSQQRMEDSSGGEQVLIVKKMKENLPQKYYIWVKVRKKKWHRVHRREEGLSLNLA